MQFVTWIISQFMLFLYFSRPRMCGDHILLHTGCRVKHVSFEGSDNDSERLTQDSLLR